MGFVTSALERHLGSFKVRLAAYFLLLALLPVLGTVWAFSEVATRSETNRADAQLHSALRTAVGSFGDRVARAEQTATSLAHATGFRDALTQKNRAALTRLYRRAPNAAFYARGQLVAGSRPSELSVRRSADVVDRKGRMLGRVVAFVALDAELLAQLQARTGVSKEDRLALVSGGDPVVGPAALRRVALPYEAPRDLEIGSQTFRGLATRLSENPDASLVVLTPKATIEAGAADLRRRMMALAALALSIAALLAYLLGRTIVRSVKQVSEAAGAIAEGKFSARVPVRGRDEFATLGRAFNDMASHLEERLEELAWQKSRTQGAIERFGHALAASHSTYRLVPVIVESIVEATGAAGGRLILDGEEITSVGKPDAGAQPLAIPLGPEGRDSGLLLLTPADGEFTDEARELAHWLASQARAALEHASLHKRLEFEAFTDGLTKLPNRRQLEESLAAELSRVERFGGALALVVADLDDFKQVNDRFGHLAGDDVLRAFAEVLRNNVRDIDTAARYGGEEFALTLPGTDLAGAESVAERIREAMAAREIKTFPGAVLTVTASFGVAAFPVCSTEEALFAAADEALYRAKAGGKNRVEVADECASLPDSAVRPGA